VTMKQLREYLERQAHDERVRATNAETPHQALMAQAREATLLELSTMIRDVEGLEESR
jgi:hypothetical protein